MFNELIDRYPCLVECREDIERAFEMIKNCYSQGGKLLLCGNGGSCADCDHIVGELMKGFLLKREVVDERLPENIRSSLQYGLPAISLSAHSATLTAFMNDVDPAMVYAQLLYGYAKPTDLFIGISTSGNSENVVNAALVASAIGIPVVVLTGKRDSKLSEIADVAIRVPETETFKVQELHLPVYHYLCAATEAHFFEK